MEVRLISNGGARALPIIAAPTVRSFDGIAWVDLDYTDEQGMALLTELIQTNPADVQDCASRVPVPKLHVYADHHYSAINGVARGTDGRLHFQPWKIFLTPALVVTVLGPTHAALTADAARRELVSIRERLDAGTFHPASAFEIVSSLRFEMLRAQELMIGAAASGIARLEQRVMETDPVRAETLLQDLVEIRHDLQTIGTNAAQTQESYVHLLQTLDSSAELMPVNRRGVEELRQGFSHLKNTTDLEREYLQELLDVFQTRVSTELNRFVRKITAYGTIGIGWTVIAGIYGMN
ncbi:MAG TPA: CorA family divalent cation transporter, partial [Actinoplanes sp.]